MSQRIVDPGTVEARILEVLARLSDTQKADVLFHALQHLPIKGSSMIMRKAVESFLQVSDVPPANAAHALFLAAKTKFAAGYYRAAEKGRHPKWHLLRGNPLSHPEDLQSALTLDPENQDVKEAIQLWQIAPETALKQTDRLTSFPEDIWHHIALFLPRPDLRSLLFVPNILSRIASQLLFREIDLQVTMCVAKRSHIRSKEEHVFQCSAEILERIVADPHFAARVRCLRIHGFSDLTTETMVLSPTYLPILIEALSKLPNLRNLHCSGMMELISPVLRTVHLHNPHLRRLSLQPLDWKTDFEMPTFRCMTHFTSCRITWPAHTLLSRNCPDLHAISISDGMVPQFPLPGLSIRHLTQMELEGRLTMDIFSQILCHCHELESLMLSGWVACAPSSLFRQHRAALPFLCHFSLDLLGFDPEHPNHDFFPATSDFLKGREQLQTYCLLTTGTADDPGPVFDASAWAVLPTLSNLRSLTMMYPKDLSPLIAGSLIPRTVRALTLYLACLWSDYSVARPNCEDFLNKLGTGTPPMLCYIGLDYLGSQMRVEDIVEDGFPNVRVVRLAHKIYTITRTRDGISVDEWPYQRLKASAIAGWFDSLGCEDTIWERVNGPQFVWPSLAGH